jgi:hypothetical protein
MVSRHTEGSNCIFLLIPRRGDDQACVPQRPLSHHGHRDSPGTGPGPTTTMEHCRGQDNNDGASRWLRSPPPEPGRGPGAPPAPPACDPGTPSRRATLIVDGRSGGGAGVLAAARVPRLRGVRRLPGPGDCRQAVDKVVDNCPDSVESVWTPEKQQVNAANFRSGSCAIRTPRAASRCTSGCTDDSAGTTRPPSSHTWRGPAGSVPHSAAAAGQARRPARQDGITSIARPRATAPPGRGCCYRSGGGATVPAAGPGPSGRSAGTTWPRR